MTIYNWQQPDWPFFRYNLSELYDTLFSIAEKMGRISGKLTHLSENLKTETLIDIMVEEAVKSSEIEGEHIRRPDVRSSIKNKLGLNPKTVKVHDKRAQGIADLMVDVRNTFKKPLTEETLFEWHLMLFSNAFNPHLRIGTWRIDEEPMQIVSGYQNKWTVHYEAPPAHTVPKEMEKFFYWFNDQNSLKIGPQFAPVRAAIAHLYFESIHPFDDGNGRIGRAISEKALSQGFGYPILLSLSRAIEADKKSYYDALKTASRSNEITHWIQYFINIISTAQTNTEEDINFILKKAAFFEKYKEALNDRQLKIIQRMMRAGVKGFAGGMSAKKYMIIADTSKATATRDLQYLCSIDALKQTGSGRSVRYELKLD